MKEYSESNTVKTINFPFVSTVAPLIKAPVSKKRKKENEIDNLDTFFSAKILGDSVPMEQIMSKTMRKLSHCIINRIRQINKDRHDTLKFVLWAYSKRILSPEETKQYLHVMFQTFSQISQCYSIINRTANFVSLDELKLIEHMINE